MWNHINSEKDALDFMKMVWDFHDCCIKEMKYKSGAYVTEQYSMYPVNDCRALCVAIQCQRKEIGMIELEFLGLKWMRLYPVDEIYTCEILDATLIVKENCIYWCDCGNLKESDLEAYSGTVICSSGLRWRKINNAMGKTDYYK